MKSLFAKLFPPEEAPPEVSVDRALRSVERSKQYEDRPRAPRKSNAAVDARAAERELSWRPCIVRHDTGFEQTGFLTDFSRTGAKVRFKTRTMPTDTVTLICDDPHIHERATVVRRDIQEVGLKYTGEAL